MRFISAVALAVCSLAVNGQDFVVTNRLDTLPGKVLIRSYPNMDKVQLNTQEKKKEYAATALSTVFLDGQIYRPVLVTDGFRLLKLERSGMVSLYMGRQSPGTPYNIPFLVKRSGESLEVTVLRFKNTMTKFLSDCSSIKQKIEEGKLGRKDLDQIINEYNLCIESQTQKAFLSSNDPRLIALTEFKNKLQLDSSIPPDALDIVTDLYSKIKENKPIPNYLTEGLRELLKNHAIFQSDLESLLLKLKG